MLNSAEHEISTAHIKVPEINGNFSFKSQKLVIYTIVSIVGILRFMSRINFNLSSVEHEKSFINSGTGFTETCLLFNKTPIKDQCP